MDGVRRERHPQLSFVSADLPDWLPWRRTDQTHRLPLGEQQDMTFLFSFLFFKKNTFTLFIPPDIHTRLTLEFCFFSYPAVVLMRLHDDLKKLCWSNHRLLASKTVRASQLCSGFLLTPWGETGFLFFVCVFWQQTGAGKAHPKRGHELEWTHMFSVRVFPCPSPVMPHSACVSHTDLSLNRTLKLLCRIFLGKTIYCLHEYLNKYTT